MIGVCSGDDDDEEEEEDVETFMQTTRLAAEGKV